MKLVRYCTHTPAYYYTYTSVTTVHHYAVHAYRTYTSKSSRHHHQGINDALFQSET